MKGKDLRKYKDEFIKLYNEGYSLRKIAEIYNINKGSVTKYITEEGELRTKGLSKEQKINAKRLYREGLNVNEISKIMNSNYSTTKRYLLSEFGNVTNAPKKYEHLYKDIVKDYKNGLCATEISKKYNVARQTVMNYVAESDIKARNYSETSRVYELNEDYFDNLDSYKSYILGIIFAKGGLNTRHAGYFLDINVYKDRMDILDKIIKELYVDDAPVLNLVDNNKSLRIPSLKLYNTLYNLGLYSVSEEKVKPLSKDIDIKEFWKGFIYAGVTLSPKYLYISGNKNYTPILSNYLKNIGINHRNEGLTGIIMERKKDINTLINEYGYDFLKPLIKDYVSSLDKSKKHSWNLVINK